MAECQLVHGMMALRSGKTSIAVQKVQLAKGLFDELGDRRSAARALVTLGQVQPLHHQVYLYVYIYIYI